MTMMTKLGNDGSFSFRPDGGKAERHSISNVIHHTIDGNGALSWTLDNGLSCWINMKESQWADLYWSIHNFYEGDVPGSDIDTDAAFPKIVEDN